MQKSVSQGQRNNYSQETVQIKRKIYLMKYKVPLRTQTQQQQTLCLLEGMAETIKQEKEIKEYKIEKHVKLFLFED